MPIQDVVRRDGLPDSVENTSASNSITFAIAFQSAMHPTAAHGVTLEVMTNHEALWTITP
jgi:hypothetical protein